MSTNFTEKTFHRLSSRSVRFVNLKTTVDNKKTRRGNYRFEVDVKEQTEEGTVKHPITLYFLPQKPDYFFDRMFSTEDEKLLATGDSRKAYLMTCQKEGSSAIVTDESVLNKNMMDSIKQKICDIFYLKQMANGSRGAVHCPYQVNKIGNFDILIGQPVLMEES